MGLPALQGDIPYIDHVLGLGDSYTRTPRAESHRQDSQRGSQRRDARLPAAAGTTRRPTARPGLGRRGRLRTQSPICLNWGFFEEAAKYADKALTLPRMPATPSNPTIRASAAKTTPRANPVRRTSSPERPRQQRRMDLGLAVQRHDIGQPAQRRILRRTAHRRRLLLFQPHADVHRRDPVHRRQIDRRIAAVRLQGALEKPRSPVSTSSACDRVRACWECSSKPTPRFRRS